MQQLTAQLRLIHSAGRLHLAISPECVELERSSGRALLRCPERGAKVRGSEDRLYRAPELKWGRAENRSDIYSLGLLMWPIFFGREPDAGSKTGGKRPLPTEGEMRLEAILCKCTELRPGARYSCCEELSEDLERLLELIE